MTEPLRFCRAAGLFLQEMKRKYTGTAVAIIARPMAENIWINFYYPELWWAAGTCLYGRDYHGDHSNEDGGQDVDDGEDEVHLKFYVFCRKSLLFSEQRDK